MSALQLIKKNFSVAAVVASAFVLVAQPAVAQDRTPAAGECAGAQAKANLEQLVLGRGVFLVRDPTRYGVDASGRSLYYVDRDDGLDVGLEQLRGGWAEVSDDEGSFERLSAYRAGAADAKQVGAGVWTRCDGDFHFSRRDEQRARRLSAEAFMRHYYRLVSERQFATAWGMLSRSVKRGIGSFRSWKAGHRRSLGTTVRSAQARLSGSRAVVSVSLRTRDRDACSGRVVRQTFRGRWVLAPRGDSWVAVREHVHKTGGGRVRLSTSDCPPPPPPPPPPPSEPAPPIPSPPSDCQGYDPCLPPGPDVDCAGGSGNGPRYVSGPVTVTGSDPYDLDRDGDGIACES